MYSDSRLSFIINLEEPGLPTDSCLFLPGVSTRLEWAAIKHAGGRHCWCQSVTVFQYNPPASFLHLWSSKSLCRFVYGVLVLFHGTSKSSDSRCCLRRGGLPDLVDKSRSKQSVYLLPRVFWLYCTRMARGWAGIFQRWSCPCQGYWLDAARQIRPGDKTQLVGLGLAWIPQVTSQQKKICCWAWLVDEKDSLYGRLGKEGAVVRWVAVAHQGLLLEWTRWQVYYSVILWVNQVFGILPLLYVLLKYQSEYYTRIINIQ